MIAQREILRDDIVDVGEIARPQVLRNLSEVSDRQDQILGQLILQLQAPATGHRRPAILRLDHFAAYSREACQDRWEP